MVKTLGFLIDYYWASDAGATTVSFLTFQAPLILLTPLLLNNAVVSGQVSFQTSLHPHCIGLSVPVEKQDQTQGEGIVKLTK